LGIFCFSWPNWSWPIFFFHWSCCSLEEVMVACLHDFLIAWLLAACWYGLQQLLCILGFCV
jgi:hypothetical protein